MISPSSRIVGLDVARGLAVVLMILSHSIKGLLYFREMPKIGIVPVHAVTKFSSTLFIVVFGLTLGLFFVRRTLDADWLRVRDRLWWRALVLLFWYKLLTVVQLFERAQWRWLKEVLLFRAFPDFVEILAFYAYSLMWLAPALVYWRRIPWQLKPVVAMLPAVIGTMLYESWSFFGLWQLKAILVEDDRLFCYGVVTRASLILMGLVIADAISMMGFERGRKWISLTGIVGGSAMLVTFVIQHWRRLPWDLDAIARNIGKHPPSTDFMIFSLGGALVLLGLSLLVVKSRWVLRPLVVIGQTALASFVFHILVIFIVFRYLFELRGHVTYPQALALTGLLFLATWGFAELWRWRGQPVTKNFKLPQTLRPKIAD